MNDALQENQINFLLHAERLLAEQFGNRLNMADIVEKAVLLDGALTSLKKAGFLADVVLKGGGALQRAYLSHRFSSNLDFACGRVPPFTPQQFNEYGKEFLSFFTSIVQKDYGINKSNVKSKLYPLTKHSDTRRVNRWVIEVRIPDSLSLLSAAQRRIQRARRVVMRDIHTEDVQTIKIEICNVPVYMKRCIPLYPSSAYNTILPDTNTEDVEEIYYEKAASLLTRKIFKYHDVFDLFLAEYFSKISDVNKDMFISKIRDQMMKKDAIFSNMKNNLKRIAPYVSNTVSFKEAMGSSMTLLGYQAIFNHAKAILEYAHDRSQRFSAILRGKSWQEPGESGSAPISIDSIAECLSTLYDNTRNEENTNEQDSNVDLGYQPAMR